MRRKKDSERREINQGYGEKIMVRIDNCIIVYN